MSKMIFEGFEGFDIKIDFDPDIVKDITEINHEEIFIPQNLKGIHPSLKWSLYEYQNQYFIFDNNGAVFIQSVYK